MVSMGAEYLVMGHLMRRNVFAYKAPPGQEGYDLICVHPDPRFRPRGRQKSMLRVQVKSRYATDAGRGFPVNEQSIDAFDFLTVVFLNIGRFKGKHDGTTDARPPEYYTLPASVIRKYHDTKSSFQKVRLQHIAEGLNRYKDSKGFDLVARALGVQRPCR